MKAGAVRASGDTAAEESAKEEAEKLDEHVDIEIEPKRTFRTPGFSRMRTDWNSDDRIVLLRIQAIVDDRLLHNFIGAYQVLNEVYDIVRTPLRDPDTGQIMTDRFGMNLWKKNVTGSYEEDWSKLTYHLRDNLLFTITTRLVEWEMLAADAWGEAMFAKAQWEERYAIGFDAPMSGTMGDREAAGRLAAADERYFAVFLSTYSRKADALVRALTRLEQRLKDSISPK